jgi:tetratricopeptide (TPR) repeat protein
MYEYAGMYENAINYFIRSTGIIREMPKIDSDALALSLNGTAWCLHLLGRDQEGLPYVKEALKYAPDNYNILDTQSCICRAVGERVENKDR